MKTLRGLRGGVVPMAAAAVLVAACGTAVASIDVSGTAVKNGMACSTTWTYDTGASQTLLSRACATMMGLLDGTGMPAAGTPMKNFNDGEVQTWCFDTVALACTDNFGNICVASTTMYVSKNNDSWATSNLLGRDWRKAVKGQWDDETEKVRWPKAAAAPAKPAVPKNDNPGGGVKRVYEDVRFFNGTNSAFCDMTYMTGSPYTILPQSVAAALGVIPMGTVNLPVNELDLYTRLAIAEQNLGHQVNFQLGLVQGFDFGLGPLGGPIQVLISNDSNSRFGVMGSNFFSGGSPDFGYIHQEDFDDQGNDAILYGPVPTPGAATVLGLAGLLAARRRR